MFRSGIARLVLVSVTMGLTAGIASSAAAVSPVPHIVARPNSLMVNTKTTLTGTGFPVKAKFTIEECSISGWVVTANPCVRGNRITVTTDAHGRFVRQFRVALCGGKRGTGPTSQICYLGDPHPRGVDTLTLLGAAKVTVTYP